MNPNPHRWSANNNGNGNGRNYDRPPRQEFQPRPAPKPIEDDKETITREEWEPNEEQFDRFLTRDLQLASGNVVMVMRNKGIPISFREMRESLLHSQDTIERILTSKIADGSVRENKGRFELVR